VLVRPVDADIIREPLPADVPEPGSAHTIAGESIAP
jgi:hypothetical protein